MFFMNAILIRFNFDLYGLQYKFPNLSHLYLYGIRRPLKFDFRFVKLQQLHFFNCVIDYAFIESFKLINSSVNVIIEIDW